MKPFLFIKRLSLPKSWTLKFRWIEYNSKDVDRLIYLVGGGALNVEWLKKLDKDDVTWIGVDRGTKSIMDADLIVDRAFGDFDSVTEEELTAIKRSVKYIEKARPDKDQTDMEMALDWALDQQKPIRMVGATGGRLEPRSEEPRVLRGVENRDHGVSP